MLGLGDEVGIDDLFEFIHIQPAFIGEKVGEELLQLGEALGILVRAERQVRSWLFLSGQSRACSGGENGHLTDGDLIEPFQALA